MRCPRCKNRIEQECHYCTFCGLNLTRNKQMKLLINYSLILVSTVIFFIILIISKPLDITLNTRYAKFNLINTVLDKKHVALIFTSENIIEDWQIACMQYYHKIDGSSFFTPYFEDKLMGNDLFLKYNFTSNKPIELLYIKEVGNADFLTLNSIKKIGIKISNPKLYKLHLPYYFVNKTDSLYKDIEKDCRRFIQ